MLTQEPLGLLPLGQLVDEVLPPVVLHALGVGDRVAAQRVQGLGEDVVIVVQAVGPEPGLVFKS